MGGALVVMVLAAVIDYRRLREWALFFFAVTTALLLGRDRPGAGPQRRRRGSTSARSSCNRRSWPRSRSSSCWPPTGRAIEGEDLPFPGFVRALGLMAVPLLIVLAQPDLGTASVARRHHHGRAAGGQANPRHIALVTGLALFSAVLVVATGTLRAPVARLTTFVDTNPANKARGQGAEPAVPAVAAGHRRPAG